MSAPLVDRMRFPGALHRLVLERRAPALAVHYPSVGGTPGDVWPAARRIVEEHLAALHELVRRPVQTDEVGRSSALLGGLLHVVAHIGHGTSGHTSESGSSACAGRCRSPPHIPYRCSARRRRSS